MDKLKIEYVPIDSIKPYKRNAKIHTQTQIEHIKKSIQEFQFQDPIGVWNNEVVEGHGRLEAAKQLGMKTVPIIRLDNLSDEQRRAYGLIHNKLSMDTGFDLDTISTELYEGITNIDMREFGFDFSIDDFDFAEVDETNSNPKADNHRSMQNDAFENQEIMQFPCNNYYGIPEIKGSQTVGDKFLRFMDWKEIEDYENYIAHFYYDDYKFMSAWREPYKFVDRLKKFKAVIAPDFSLYTDFPRALQILSCYRRNWCAAYWQSLDIDIIPDVVWGDEQSYDFCFEGIPKHSTVAVSSVGVKKDKEWNAKENSLFKKGYDEMMNRLEPKTVLYYGSMIDGLEGNIIRIPSFYELKRDYLNRRARAKENEEKNK